MMPSVACTRESERWPRRRMNRPPRSSGGGAAGPDAGSALIVQAYQPQATRTRGAPRLRRGAPNVWGFGGHVEAHMKTRRAPRSAGALRTSGGLGGHVEAPMKTRG